MRKLVLSRTTWIMLLSLVLSSSVTLLQTPVAQAGVSETPTLISVKIVRGSSATLTILPPTNTTNLLGYKFTTNAGTTWKDWTVTVSGVYRIMTIDERSNNSSLWGAGQSITFQVCPVYSPSTFTPGTFGDGNVAATSSTCADNNASQSNAVIGIDGAPSEPTNVSVSATGDSTITLTFTAPADAGASAITNYQYSLDNGVSWVSLNPLDATSPITFTTTNGTTALSNGTTYAISIRAVNTSGGGASSFPNVNATPSAPIVISGGSGVTTTYGTSISGTAFSSTGGGGAINWTVVKDSDLSPISGITMAGSSISVSGSAPAGNYVVRVTATDTLSVPVRTNSTTATVIVNPLTLSSTSSLSLYLHTGLDRAIRVTWSSVENAASYQITVKNAITLQTISTVNVASGTTSTVISKSTTSTALPLGVSVMVTLVVKGSGNFADSEGSSVVNSVTPLTRVRGSARSGR